MRGSSRRDRHPWRRKGAQTEHGRGDRNKSWETTQRVEDARKHEPFRYLTLSDAISGAPLTNFVGCNVGQNIKLRVRCLQTRLDVYRSKRVEGAECN